MLHPRRNLVQIQPHLVRLYPKTAPIHISQGRTVMATDLDGLIDGGAEVGLFVYETRMLSRWRYRIDDEAPIPVVLSNVRRHSWLGYYIGVPPGIEVPEPDFGSGLMRPVSEQTLELRVSRVVGEGLLEELDLTNFTQQHSRFTLTLEVDADFADPDETRRGRSQHGDLRKQWRHGNDGTPELDFDYHAQHHFDHQGESGVARIDRGIAIRIREADSPPSYEDGQLRFEVHLAPGACWHACLELVPRVDGRELPMHYGCSPSSDEDNEYERKRSMFLDESTTFRGPGSGTMIPSVLRTLEQARSDLASLRLFDLDHGDRSWTVAAGLPIYVAPFGRDMLTASWQSGLIGPELLRGSLQELAERQGTRTDDWRDEQPGRMPHESHPGPLDALNYLPFGRYYGSSTASAFYPVAVAELWHWTGDRSQVEPLVEPALKALKWVDEHGDLDGDGFYEYRTQSECGVVHQAWKDSPGAIVSEDGRPIDPPVATSETQAFVFGAKLHFAEVLWWLGRGGEARRLLHEAMELKKRFNDAFWLDDEQFFAMGLGPDKRPIRSVASNAAHCVAAALADEERVGPTTDRLMSPELFSGWGIRTLSDRHPSYNPYSYHRGSVWPVAQGTFALMFYRYGMHDRVDLLCRSMFEAATLFDFHQLPEVFSGHPRDDAHPFPALYPQANAPQAWSSSSVFVMLQAMLGLYPYAPLNMLLVDPHLPDWLPEITIENLRVGNASTTIRFHRRDDGRSDYDVLDHRGTLHVVRQPSPWSLTASPGERIKDLLTSLLPGK